MTPIKSNTPSVIEAASSPRRLNLTRRSLLVGLGAAGLLAAATLRPVGALGREPTGNLLFDVPEIPVGGNQEGSLTIVSFFDYNCPFCRRASGPLDDVVREDGDIRLVYKDWPILSKASVTGAIMALAAHRQDRYEVAHHALMSLEGRADDAAMREAVASADLDLPRLEKDVADASVEINGLLQRNFAQADELDLLCTPAYIVGRLLVTSALDADGFRQVVADARKRLDE
ncbi:MAG TPA: DsbA family protein [Saliniramus sp.]|nr:DsbA family protein [Saliniramus sp.]